MDLMDLIKHITENQERFEVAKEEAHRMIDELEPDDQLVMMKVPTGTSSVEVIKFNMDLKDEADLFTSYLLQQFDAE